jgi:hypothetical protein
MADTTATDVLVIVFNAMSPDEQDEALGRLTDVRAHRDSAGESHMAYCIRSLRRVAEHVGRVPSSDDYRLAQPELTAAGEDIETFSRLYRAFDSNWRRVREALELSESNTVRKIEARFRSRRVGKVWRFTDEMLRETMARCVEHYGRPPMVSEFDWWRDRELELAKARGDDALHLPSPSPYRRRYGSWEGALVAFGYTPEQLAQRLEQP